MSNAEELVERLRKMPKFSPLCAEAADLIERQDAEIAALRNISKVEASRLDWLEQTSWEDAEQCLRFVDKWIGKNGKRHPGGLRDAIDAAMKEPVGAGGGT